MSKDAIQYTIRGITPAADARLKAQAKKRGISLNQLVLSKLDVLETKTANPKIYHDLDWFFEDMTPERLADAEELNRIIWEERRKAKARAQSEFEAEKARGEWD